MRARRWGGPAVVASAAIVIGACSASSAPEEVASTDDQALIACGFIDCPRGMRCKPTRDGGGPVEAGADGAVEDDARLRTYGVCVPDPCSLHRCPIAGTRCVEHATDGGVTASCVISPCSMIHCLTGTTCVEHEHPNGALTASCERDPCAFIHCIGGLHCEPRDTAAGRVGLCVR